MNDRVNLVPLRPRDQDKPPQPPSGGQTPTSAPLSLGEFRAIGPGGTDGAKEELKNIDLLKVYKRLFPNKQVSRTTGNEETQVQCFNEAGHSHGDRNPSMSINTDKQAFMCFGCDAGGDIFSMIAYKMGYATSDLACPPDKIHQAVYDANSLLALGWDFHQASDGNWYRSTESQKARMARPAQPENLNSQSRVDGSENQANNVVQFPAGFAAEEPVIQAPPPEPPPELNWRELLENNTPLRAYMEQVCIDDVPEEFHFWNIMLLIGLLIGRDVALADSRPVYANLFVCLNGTTSMGKSRSMSYVKDLISRPEIAFDEDDPYSRGVKKISQPGSGEVLTKSFVHESVDPKAAIPALVPGQKNTPSKKLPKIQSPVRGLVEFEELSGLVRKAEGKGSTIKPMLIELYDCGKTIGGSSLSHGSYQASEPFGSVLSSVQPDVLEGLFSGNDNNDAASGFLNRWLFIPGTPKTRQAMGKQINLDPVVPYLVNIQNWASDMKSNAAGLLEFAHQAELDRFEAICNELVFPNEAEHGLQRLHVLFKKLIVIACANNSSDYVDEDSLELARKLLVWVIRATRATNIQEIGTVTVADRMRDAIRTLLLKADKEGMPPSVIRQRVSKKFGNMYDEKVYDMVLKTLKNEDEIFEGSDSTGRGRPKKRLVHTRYENHWIL
ncbi:hypothetical protein SEA_CAMERICO_1 [Gordonia phage Camerico]|nr:hypothetical protein SEA_CAMERICO_1 [Gordonia phage Camerico]